MNSFRSKFAPIIAETIKKNHGKNIKELRKILRKKWSSEVKNISNEYMVSEWSREVKRQLAPHPDNQKSFKNLPLFIKTG